MTHALDKKISLSDIIPPMVMSPNPGSGYSLWLYHIDSLVPCDALPSGGMNDEESVNKWGKRASLDRTKYLVVVIHEGKATAIYRDGEKVA